MRDSTIIAFLCFLHSVRWAGSGTPQPTWYCVFSAVSWAILALMWAFIAWRERNDANVR